MCVYDIYLEDMQLYHENIAAAKQQILARAKKHSARSRVRLQQEWPVDELGPLLDVDDPGGSAMNAKVAAEKELERTRAQLDPALRSVLTAKVLRVKVDFNLRADADSSGYRAFLEMEARLKKKEQERKAESN